MGKSQSITDLAKKNEKFQEYIEKLKTQLDENSDKEKKKMDAEIEKYYKDNKFNKIEHIAGVNSDFMQKSEWSLENVKKIIETITQSMFGNATPPAGVKVNEDVSISAAIKKLTDFDTYILTKSFQVITGIVSSLGDSNTIKYKYQFKHESLGNGFHLFATVVCDSYEGYSFLKTEEIHEYLYIYRVCFSEDEASKEGKMMTIKTYQDEIATFNDLIEFNLQELKKKNINLTQYKEIRTSYLEMIDQSQKKLDELRIKNIRQKELKSSVFI
jgi:hypothetical protein